MTQTVRKTKRDDFPVIPLIIIFFMALFALVFGFNKLNDDFPVVIRWWIDLFAIGIAFFPITYVIFHRFHDCGYIAGKAIGLAIGSWVVWLLSSLHIAGFSEKNTIILLIVCAVINYAVYFIWCNKTKNVMFKEVTTEKYTLMIFYEVLFLLLFILWCYMKSYNVKISNDTEKYMDFGFLASIMNTKFMPPNDMWFSGEPINYYYYGIYVAGYMGKLAGTTAGYAYNLALMTIAALSCMEAYSIVYELIHLVSDEHYRRKEAITAVSEEGLHTIRTKAAAHFAGLLGGLAVTIAGNMHYVIYRFIMPFLERTSGNTPTGYWFPNATRYITDGKSISEGTLIHEFPSYSFVLGDLHAHVTDINFALLAMMLMLAFLMNRSERMKAAREQGIFDAVSKGYYVREALNPALLMASFLIGIISITNSWDFPIYFVVAGAFIMFSNAVVLGFKLPTLILTGINAAECLVISTIVSLPFKIKFKSMTAGIGICKYHSNPWELAVLWGLPLILCITLYVANIKAYRAKLKERAEKSTKKPASGRKQDVYIMSHEGEDKVHHLYSFIFKLELSDLFTMVLAICAAGLLLMCEIIYVADIYGGIYQRTNTYFKLSYQAFMMFGIVMAYAIVRFIVFFETEKRRNIALVAGFLLIVSFGYFPLSVKSYIGDVTKEPDGYERTLDSYKMIAITEKSGSDGFVNTTKTAAEYLQDTVYWVMDNIEPDAVIAQMCSTSYKPFAIISAYTGNPTPIGWAFHEWLWRNGGTLAFPPEVSERVQDIKTLYTTDSIEEAVRIIRKYNIDYIYVGYQETMYGYEIMNEPAEDRTYYRNSFYPTIDTNHEILMSLGEKVFDNGVVSYRDKYWVNGYEKEYAKSYLNYIVKVADIYK